MTEKLAQVAGAVVEESSNLGLGFLCVNYGSC